MNIKKITILGLTMLTVCSVSACSKEQAYDVTYTLKAKYVDGTKLGNCTVKVTDASGNEVARGKTDKYGMYSFEGKSNQTYGARIIDMPAGYKIVEYKFDKDNTYINATVTSTVINGDLPKNYVYSPGEIAYDYTLTDYKDSSKTYNFKKLLEEKPCIVLNFFYVGCGPCEMEFPTIEKAYQKYSDKISLIAIDTYYNQTATLLDNYRDNTLGGISFPMCFDKKNPLANIFDVMYVPTTVVIDKYGRVDYYSYGADDNQNNWEKLFAKYSAESYEIGDPDWMAKDW